MLLSNEVSLVQIIKIQIWTNNLLLSDFFIGIGKNQLWHNRIHFLNFTGNLSNKMTIYLLELIKPFGMQHLKHANLMYES
jgi:hypothetical protein